MKKVIHALDTFVLSVGDATINTCDFVGGVTIETLNLPKRLAHKGNVKKAIGGTIVCTSVLSAVGFSLYKPDDTPHHSQPGFHQPVDHKPLLVDRQTDLKQDKSDVAESTEVETSTPSPDLKYLLNSDFVNFKPLSEVQLIQLKKVTDYQGRTPFKQAILSMSPTAQLKFYKLITEYNRITGEKVVIKSAYRSKQVQQSLKAQYKDRAADECSSPHAIGAMDIDRVGEVSRQVSAMRKLGLLNKFGLWVPPYVGEAWHIEDPEAVYFRFWKKKDPQRKIYSTNVCNGLDGVQHEKWRKKNRLFSVVDTHTRISTIADQQLASRNITGEKAALIKRYLLMAVMSESKYGRRMVSPTGALGWWQFTSKTAKQYNLKYPMQLDESMRATIDLVLDNEIDLIKRGITPTIDNLYKAHMIGAYGLSLVNKAEAGQPLSSEEVDTLLKVVYHQIGKSNRTIEMVNDKFIPRVEIKYIAANYNSYFNKKIKVFLNDNKYLDTLASA